MGRWAFHAPVRLPGMGACRHSSPPHHAQIIILTPSDNRVSQVPFSPFTLVYHLPLLAQWWNIWILKT